MQFPIILYLPGLSISVDWLTLEPWLSSIPLPLLRPVPFPFRPILITLLSFVRLRSFFSGFCFVFVAVAVVVFVVVICVAACLLRQCANYY